MRLTRIDFEGRPGHYATAQRRAGSGSAPNLVVVTILTPEHPDGDELHAVACREDDLRSLAECLQRRLEDRPDGGGDVDAYYAELLRLSDCERKETAPMENPSGIETLRRELRHLSILVDEQGLHAVFGPNDCPFVDEACERVKHGGRADHAVLASLLHHVAENLRS